MSVRYRRVVNAEEESADDEEKKRRADKIEMISAKIHAAVWVAAAIGLAYWTDFFHVVYNGDGLNRTALNVALVLFSVNMCIMLYLTLYLPIIAKITLPWEIYCPRMIPTSTILGILCIILLMIAFWPRWGIASPIFVMVLLMGFLFSAHFIPWPC